MEIPKQGEIYRHFKGNKYEIVCVARDCENPKNKFVIYESLNSSGNFPAGTIWGRSLEDFCGEKVFGEDVIFNGVHHKEGERIKRFIEIRR